MTSIPQRAGRSRIASTWMQRPHVRQELSSMPPLRSTTDADAAGGCGGADDVYAGDEEADDDGIPESLSAKVGGTRLSLQRATTAKNIAQSTCGKGTPPQGMVLAGLFPDTAILTFHNIELEVLPQVKRNG